MLDESHMIKTSDSQSAKICTQLTGKRRWCVTGKAVSTSPAQSLLTSLAPCLAGTPISHSLKDMLSQIRFLNVPIFGKPSVFNNLLADQPAALTVLLSRIVTRHSAKQRFNGKVILELPTKTQHDIVVTMDAVERQAYDATAAEIRARYEAVRALGPRGMKRFTIKLMSLLLPLRQACSGGPALPLPEKTEADLILDQLSTKTVEERQKMLDQLPQLSITASGECPICLDVKEDPVITKCQHEFCFQCISSYIAASVYNDTAPCPLCRKDIKLRQLNRIDAAGDGGSAAKRSKAAEPEPEETDVPAAEMVVYESKLKALIVKLEEIRADDPSAKVGREGRAAAVVCHCGR